MSTNLSSKTATPAGAIPAPGGVPGELASPARFVRGVRLPSGATGRGLATAAMAAALVGALIAAGTMATAAPAPAPAETRAAPGAASVQPPAVPTSLAFGAEDIAFQNEIEMSLLRTR